ncbi:4a-hydroxytetrahydrobiopterin dehydratase [Candidatus Berkelbacteria bacterium]|nr:4a-hydroxytetrahydrobiopterin dehydratase [Candidatus Berkelbacteria bacterium]
MPDLSQNHCVPCRGGEPVLGEAEISKFKNQISKMWDVVDEIHPSTGLRIKKLRRFFKFKNFAQALAFVNKVGELAESEGHHPEIEFGWGHATITWWTHKINGLHHNDFIMAAKTDALPQISPQINTDT